MTKFNDLSKIIHLYKLLRIKRKQYVYRLGAILNTLYGFSLPKGNLTIINTNKLINFS